MKMCLPCLIYCLNELRDEIKLCGIQIDELPIDGVSVSNLDEMIYVILKPDAGLTTFQKLLFNPKFENFICKPLLHNYEHSATLNVCYKSGVDSQRTIEIVLSVCSKTEVDYAKIKENQALLRKACLIASTNGICIDTDNCKNCKISQTLKVLGGR